MNIKVEEAKLADKKFIIEAQIKMALETEDLELSYETVNKGVSKVFNKKCLGKYFIASNQDENVGCLLVQYEWSDWRNGWVLWIHSVFVEKEYRHHGIFNKLFLKVKEIKAKDAEVMGIRLFVDKTNSAASNVYEKMGMSKEHYSLYELMF